MQAAGEAGVLGLTLSSQVPSSGGDLGQGEEPRKKKPPSLA